MRNTSLFLLIVVTVSIVAVQGAGLTQVARTEEGLRAQAMNIIANELTDKCHGIMWPQVVIFTGSLSLGCKLLHQAAATLVASGYCTQSDIDKLEPIVCYVQTVDPDEVVRHINESSWSSVECRSYAIIAYKGDQLYRSKCNSTLGFKDAMLSLNCTDQDLLTLLKYLCQSDQIEINSSDSSDEIENIIVSMTTTQNNATVNISHEIQNVLSFSTVSFRLTQDAITEEVRRTRALEIIANELTDKCNVTLLPQVFNFTGSLSSGCKLLQNETSTLVSSGFCSQSDIDKLEPIICYNQTVDPDEVVRHINESSWSSKECRSYAIIAYKDDQLYRSKCNSTMGFKDAMQSLNCTDKDLLTLLKYVCQFDPIKINSPNFSDQTENTTVSMTTAQSTASVNMSQEIQTILSDPMFPSNCREAFQSEILNSTENWCSKMTSNCSDTETTSFINCSLTVSMLQVNCSGDELHTIYNKLCLQTTSTTESITTLTTMKISPRVIVNDTIREKIFDFISHNITASCRWTVGPRIPRPLTDLRRVCKMFTQSGGALVSNHICTTDEVIKLTGIFCRLDFKAGLRPVASTEEGRRAQAMDIMANELTDKCHGIMWPQVVIFTGSLTTGCNLLQQAAATLVASGYCTQSDIDKLEPIVCYVQPVDPDILRFQVKLNQVLNEMGELCNSTLHSDLVNVTSETEACRLWMGTKTYLLNENICSDHDVSLFTTTLCSGQEVTSLSLLTFLLYFILATVLQK